MSKITPINSSFCTKKRLFVIQISFSNCWTENKKPIPFSIRRLRKEGFEDFVVIRIILLSFIAIYMSWYPGTIK